MNLTRPFNLALLIGVSSLAMAQGPGPGRRDELRGMALPPMLQLAISRNGTQRYIGTKSTEFRRDGDTTRRIELVTADGPKTRIEFPSGSPMAGQIVVETPQERREYFPRTNTIRVSDGRGSDFSRMPSLLRRMGPRIKVTEGEIVTIAGRRAREVKFTDPSGNNRQIVAVDTETGLILRRQIFDFVGTVIAGFEFTKISYRDDIDPRLFKLNRAGAKVEMPLDELKRLATKNDFAVAYLPNISGYRLEVSRVMDPPTGKVLLQLYRGPEGRVSLFQTSSEISPDRLRQFGKQDVETRSWSSGGRYFALIGNVPASTLDRLKRQVVQSP
jgi:hypothetical protein